jgi:hypothetical protein
VAWKKVLLFGLFGAVGCLAGWLVGEPYLLIADAATPTDASRAPTLISKPAPPSSEPPPAPREFQERLSAAGAKTGDVQISLIWFDENDLDLHCFDPYGFEICWKPGQKIAPRSHGELDVDRNAGCRVIVPEPVENIYWARGTAPQGKYSVHLDFYQRCGRGPDESKYRINVLHGGERKEFSGTIRKEGTVEGGGPMKLIYEFQLRPQIELFAPTEFEIVPGTAALKVPVAVRREFYQGNVDVRVEGLPAGVTADALTLQPSQDTGELTLKSTDAAVAGKLKIKFVATGDGVNHSKDVDLTIARPAQFSLWAVLSIGFWTALLAVGLCLALVAGQNNYLGKSPFASGRVPLALVIVGAAVAGFASGSIGQALYSLFLAADVSLGFIGRLLGWTLLGGLLGWGVSFFVPNLDAKKSALAGLGGGFLGGLAFAIMSSVTGATFRSQYAAGISGRLGGSALLGFCAARLLYRADGRHRRDGVPAGVARSAVQRARGDYREPRPGTGESGRRLARLYRVGARRGADRTAVLDPRQQGVLRGRADQARSYRWRCRHARGGERDGRGAHHERTSSGRCGPASGPHAPGSSRDAGSARAGRFARSATDSGSRGGRCDSATAPREDRAARLRRRLAHADRSAPTAAPCCEVDPRRGRLPGAGAPAVGAVRGSRTQARAAGAETAGSRGAECREAGTGRFFGAETAGARGTGRARERCEDERSGRVPDLRAQGAGRARRAVLHGVRQDVLSNHNEPRPQGSGAT